MKYLTSTLHNNNSFLANRDNIMAGEVLRQETDPDLLGTGSEFLLAQLYRHQNGDLEFPKIDTEFRSMTRPEVTPWQQGGILETTVTMSDNTKHDVVIGIPKVLGSNIAVVTELPLGIPIHHAHNKRTLEGLTGLDFLTVMVGHPEGWGVKNNPVNNAHDTRQILSTLLPGFDVDPKQILGVGGSRGAINVLGLRVPQIGGDLKVPYADIQAPCGPRPPGTIKEWLDVMAYIPEVSKKIGIMTLRKILNGDPSDLKNLFNSDPAQGLNSGKFFLNIASSGIAGQMAIAGDTESHMHVQLLEDDVWAPVPSWRLAFRDQDNVVLEVERGGHERVAADETRNEMLGRLSALREARGFDGTLTHNDYMEIMGASPKPDELADKRHRRSLASVA